MARQIKVDRRYSLGDYKYITFFDEFEVSDDLIFNQDVVSRIRFLQILSMEVAYRKYLKLVLEYPHTANNIEEGIKALEAMQVEELNSLKDILPELSEKINGQKLEN